MNEITAVGGLILVAIALGLLDLRTLPVADFLPALLLAGLAGKAWAKTGQEIEP